MKKTIYSLILVVVGSVVSYLLEIDFSPHKKACPPSQQENSLIRIDLSSDDEEKKNGGLNGKFITKSKQSDKESA